MQYMVTFPLTKDFYSERVSRFLETGAPPPDENTEDRPLPLGQSFVLRSQYQLQHNLG